ncbi:MAG TPA: DUF488 domain-containing protein [Methylomirabilota bacterium]|nr:DUF488 domain-containing protein [Methylomirabilota bacterium]
MGTRVVHTIGHSNRSLDEFLELLAAHGIEELVDIRTIPRSRHNPHFDADRLPAALAAAGVGYAHVKALGGLRRAGSDSVNAGWRNAWFRGFADYMATSDFEGGVSRLEAIASRRRAAIMCAEAVPWRCHRSLVADALALREWQVLHIQSRRIATPHAVTPFLKVRAGKPIYPAPDD